jgi:hypothetical protein
MTNDAKRAFRIAILIAVLAAGAAVAFAVESFLRVSKDYEEAQVFLVVKDSSETIHMVEQIGVSRVLQKLRAESESVEGLCHLEAHAVGVAAYTLYGESAYTKCDSSCHFGCYHGAMDRMVEEEGTSELIKTVETLCSSFDTAFDRYSCFHGSGHGILTSAKYDLIAALESCRLLSSEEARDGCFEGVFMENYDAGGGKSSGAKINWLSAIDVHFPCTKFSEGDPVLRWCYDTQARWFLKMSGKDVAKAAAECMRAPEEAVPKCLGSIAKYTIDRRFDNPAVTEAFCLSVPEKYFEACIGAAATFTMFVFDRDQSGAGVEICKHMNNDGAKRVCYAYETEAIQDLYPSVAERADICRFFESPYDDVCVKRVENESL